MSTKICVIIPFYNSAQTLKRSVKSVVSQSFQDWELILVNDASTDASLKIAKNMAQGDHRIKIIDKQINEKALKARETGLKNSFSEYVAFLDADDVFYPEALAHLYQSAVVNKSDVVIGSFRKSYGKYGLIKSKATNLVPNQLIDGTFKGNEIDDKFGLAFYGNHCIPVMSWGKLFSREIFRSFLSRDIPPIHAFDDTLMSLLVIREASRITFIKKLIVSYNYGGMTSKTSHQIPYEITELHKIRLELLKNNHNAQAFRFSMLEYINTLYQYLYNCVLRGDFAEKQFVETVYKMNCVIYKEELMKFVQSNPNIPYRHFFIFLFSDDLKHAFSILSEAAKKERFKYQMKLLASRILKII